MYVGVGPPPPPPARQEGQPQPKPPSRHGDQGGGGGGVGQMGFRAIPPPAKQSSSRLVIGQIFLRTLGQSKIVSGAFGASQFRPKNLFSAFGASNNSGSAWDRGGPPHSPPPPPHSPSVPSSPPPSPRTSSRPPCPPPQVLRFNAYYLEPIVESAIETVRLRKCVVYFHTEDNTVLVRELPQPNAGVPPLPPVASDSAVTQKGGGGGQGRMAGHHRSPPPPPDQSDHRGKQRNLPLIKSDWAIFFAQTFGSQIPPPLPRFPPSNTYGGG